MPDTTSNPAVVNCDTRHFIIIMVIASKVSKIDGKIAPLPVQFPVIVTLLIFTFIAGHGSVVALG